MKKSAINLIIFITTVSAMQPVDSQNTLPKNSYTLVYDGAIIENVPGRVSIYPVTV
jgi:hypothetical protein